MSDEALTNRYGSIASEIYDLDKPVGALPDTAFHLRRFAGFRGRMLEPACGSGRTLLPLLEAGCDVTGFDPSSEMLERCRERCARAGHSPPLSLQRFDDFQYGEPFAAILLPVGSFTLIEDFDRALEVLRRFRDHLTVGGVLVIDLPTFSAMAEAGADRRRWEAVNGDLLTLEGHRLKTDWVAQRTESAARYERWRDGRLLETQLEIMVQRHWGIEEFRLALEAVGFGEISLVGDYGRARAPGAARREFTFEAHRL